MSGWEPAWVPDGRGGFRRNNNTNNNNPISNNDSSNNTNKKPKNDVEEGEESGEMKESSSTTITTPKLGGGMAKKNRKGSGGGDDDEEEGEIANTPGGGNKGGGGGGPPPSRNPPGNLDNYRSPFRGGGGRGGPHPGGPMNNSRFGPSGGGGRGGDHHHRPRHQQQHRNSFTGATQLQQQQRGFGSSSPTGGGGQGHERSFSSGGSVGSGGPATGTAAFGGGGGGPSSSRMGVGDLQQQPLSKKPPLSSFRDRELPKDSRSFNRDYGDSSSGGGGGPPPFGPGGGGRDFGSSGRKDVPSSHPDDGPPPKSGYHRSTSSGGVSDTPSSSSSRVGGDFHHREHVPFRDRDYHRDRDHHHRGGGVASTGPISSSSEPKGRDYSRGGDFGGGGSIRGPPSSDTLNRDYRGGGGGGMDIKGPIRDFRDRNDGGGSSSRDFGGRPGGSNPLSKRDGGGGGFGRDPYPNNNDRMPGGDTRGGGEGGGGFKSVQSSSLHNRGDSASTYGSTTSREGSFRDGPSRDIPFRDGHPSSSRGGGGGDSRDIPSKEPLFQGVSRDRDIPFGKRERDPPPFGSGGGGSQYTRGGESLVDRRPSFEMKEDHHHHKRESSFGGPGIPPDSNFGPKKRVESRDPISRLVGPGLQRLNNPPFRGDGIGGGGGSGYRGSASDLDKGAHRAADLALGSTASSPPSYPPASAAANPALGIGLQSTNPAVATRPTDPRRPADPRRRPSKEPVVSAGQPDISSALLSQEGSGTKRYPLAADVGGNISSSDDKLQETAKPKLPSPHPARRLGSYSSLADNASIPSSGGMPPPSPAQVDRPVTSGGGPRHGLGGYRASPLPRRLSKEGFSPRNEQRGDYYGPPGGGTARLRSPANDRGRSLVANASSPNPNKIGIQGTSATTSQQPPFAPAMTSSGGRLPHFRQNDPRFKLHERVKAEKEASYLSAPSARGEKEIGNAKTQQAHGSSGDAVGTDSPKKHSQNLQVDPFGRTRDWTDNSKMASHQMAPGTTPASPTKKRQISTALASAQSREQSHTAMGPGMDRGRSNVASVSRPAENTKAVNSRNEVPPSKVEGLPPLRTSSLGDDTVVKRAEAALKDLRVVISDPFPKTGNKDEAELPTKQQIMTAVTELEKMIKETQKAIEESSKEKLEVRNEEYAEFQKEKEESEALESERIVERDRKLSEHKQEEDSLKKIGLQKAIEDNKGLFLDAQKKLEEELEDQISQAKDDEKRRCYQDMESQMSTAASTFDKEIARAKRDVEKARTAAQNLDSKVSTAETQYRALIETKGDAMKSGRSREDEISSSIVGVVSSITAENKRKAAEAQMLSLSMLCDDQELQPESSEVSVETRDPLHGKSFEEWGVLTKRVTGLSDALYSEPAESPYFKHNERIHAAIRPSVKEYIRDKQKRLLENWTQLAEEYEVRKRLYEKQQKKLTKKARSGSVSVAGRKSILGNKDSGERPVFERVEGILESSSRPSNNPYRRARRGNEVRSEYEQDLIIAEIAAKEAMEKRIAHGSSKVPRQICRLERELSASYVNTFTACKVDDPLQEAQTETITNVWSDMEKSIFFDRFLQFPKDFRRIASFLRNKSTKDCVAFYYDSKQSVPYKGALKEHIMRRKRRGDYQIWDASIQAAISVGATVKPGPSAEKPVAFSLPPSDRTFNTRLLHPLTRDVLDSIPIDENLARMAEEDVPEETKPRSRKRSRDPLFSLEKEQTKYLCKASQESLSGAHPVKLTVAASKQVPLDEASKPVESESAGQTPGRRAPQKWTASEKKIFEDTVEEHGRDWAMLAKAVGTKSISQIKNYYYDFKKQKGRQKSSTDKKNTARRAAASSKTDPSKTNDNDNEAKARKKETAAERVDAEVEILAVTPPPPRKEKKREMRQMMVDPATSQIRSEEVAGQHRPTFQADSARETTSHVDRSTGLMSATSQNPEVTSSAQIPAQHDTSEYGDTATNRVLLQQLLRQQLQQQQEQQQQQQQDMSHHRQDMSHHRLSQHRQEMSQRQQDLSRHRQALQHQQLHLGQQPQSAIQQALSQHHQRDSQPMDELHRLLQQQQQQQQQQHQQQSQSHQQQSFPNLLPWVTASQLLQHNQPRVQHHHQDGNQLAEMNDVANIQRLLQIQQGQAPTPYGVSSAGHSSLSSFLAGGGRQSTSNSGISPSLLSQLDQLHAAGAPGGSSEATASGISAALSGGQGLENLSGLAGAQGLLSFGGGNHLSGSNPTNSLGGLTGTSGLYRQGGNGGQGIDPSGVPDALSLLTSAMSRRDGPGHGFGGVPDRNDGGGGRY